MLLVLAVRWSGQGTSVSNTKYICKDRKDENDNDDQTTVENVKRRMLDALDDPDSSPSNSVVIHYSW